MGYPQGLDEIDERRLVEEMVRRRAARAAGLCDYCGALIGSLPSCRFAYRHNWEPPVGASLMESTDGEG